MDDATHGRLNVAGINVIRALDGRGIRVMGARTLDYDPSWRYVNVRRLMSMISQSIDEQLQWAVFETNNPVLWGDVDRVVRGFLTTIWSQGMLDGSSPDEAFEIACDETTNPPYEQDAGRLTCDITLNLPWPAEFVVVRLGVRDGVIEIVEGAR